MLQVTAKQLAGSMNVDYLQASALLKILAKRGVAKKVRDEKSASGKGKPSEVFELPDTITLVLTGEDPVEPVQETPQSLFTEDLTATKE